VCREVSSEQTFEKLSTEEDPGLSGDVAEGKVGDNIFEGTLGNVLVDRYAHLCRAGLEAFNCQAVTHELPDNLPFVFDDLEIVARRAGSGNAAIRGLAQQKRRRRQDIHSDIVPAFDDRVLDGIRGDCDRADCGFERGLVDVEKERLGRNGAGTNLAHDIEALV